MLLLFFNVILLDWSASDSGVVGTVSATVQSTTGASSLSGPTSVVTFNNPVAGSSNSAGNSSGSNVGNGGSTPVNLPAVLKDRVPNTLRPGGSRGPPPPVPPRSPKRVNVNTPTSQTGSAKGDHSQA